MVGCVEERVIWRGEALPEPSNLLDIRMGCRIAGDFDAFHDSLTSSVVQAIDSDGFPRHRVNSHAHSIELGRALGHFQFRG